MKTVRIPKYLQELFGQEISLVELGITLLGMFVLSSLLLITTLEVWTQLPLWRQILVILIILDITGGIFANLSYSTNQYYRKDSKARRFFILIHVQPMILTFLLNTAYEISIIVTLYTMLAAFIVNALISHPAQRMVGAAFAVIGISFLLLTAQETPTLLLALFVMHMGKVIYCFAVDHYAKRALK